MARKKHKKSTNTKQTPNAYISAGKARLLPIGNCFINANWKVAGLANIIVSRKHVTGNITYGVYLVDLLWKGVSDCQVRFNVPEEEITEFFDEEVELVPIDYNTAHNIIYGADAFAGDFDIKPHPDFELARMILEEDDDSIPIIDIEFGKDGKPFIITRIESEGYNDDDDEYFDEDDEDDLFNSESDDNEEEKKEAKDAHSPGNETRSADDSWRQEIIDEDPAPLLSGWSRSQWEDFLTNPKNRLPGDPFIDKVLLYLFDVCFRELNTDPQLDWDAVVEKTASQLFGITARPIKTDDYIPSAEEEKLFLESYHLVEDRNSGTSREQYKQHLKLLLEGIKRWPGNRQLYNSLHNIYALLGEEEKLEEILKKTVTLFPGYLFGLVNYAKNQILKGKAKMVPAIMKHAYTITELYPARDVFHVSEIFSFNQIWFEYFVSEKQILKARHYRLQLEENIPPAYSGMKQMRSSFEKFDIHCRLAIGVYMDQASRDPGFRATMIDVLMAYSS